MLKEVELDLEPLTYFELNDEAQIRKKRLKYKILKDESRKQGRNKNAESANL